MHQGASRSLRNFSFILASLGRQVTHRFLDDLCVIEQWKPQVHPNLSAVRNASLPIEHFGVEICTIKLSSLFLAIEKGIVTDNSSMNRFTIVQQCLTLRLLFALVCLSLAGCAPSLVTQQAVADYRTEALKVSIGDARGYVLSILQTSQDVIPAHFKKRPERYLSYGVQVEIHFIRTDLASGMANADEDFTPYLFKNDVLVSVGWRYVSKTEFLEKAREAMSADGVKADQDVVGDRQY